MMSMCKAWIVSRPNIGRGRAANEVPAVDRGASFPIAKKHAHLLAQASDLFKKSAARRSNPHSSPVNPHAPVTDEPERFGIGFAFGGEDSRRERLDRVV